jgi:hypothetical protein
MRRHSLVPLLAGLALASLAAAGLNPPAAAPRGAAAYVGPCHQELPLVPAVLARRMRTR